MRSLRARLTFGLTAVLAVVLVVAGALAARGAERSEREALDDRLIRTAELSRATAVQAVQEALPAGDSRLDAVLSATRTSLRLVLGDTPLVDTGDPWPPPPRKLRRGLSTYERDGVRYRAFVATLRDPSLGGLARIELATRLTALEERQADLRNRLLLLGALALAVAALGVFLASGLVLRPLGRLRAATARIASEEDLGRRVDASRGPKETRALAASFNAMLARLSTSAADRERAIEATRRFAADAGHELRTPLMSIQARLATLARHPDQPADKRAAMAAEALDQQRRLVALLDGLQALARGDATPPLAPVDLADLADQALAAARDRHPSVDFSCELPQTAIVEGWEPGLRSVLDNLLENAARHGRSDGRVRLTVSRSEIVVEDDGPGIPDAQRDRVFVPFVRLDEDVEGTGLGLALVAQQAEHHDAAVAVDRSPGLGGARVAVRF